MVTDPAFDREAEALAAAFSLMRVALDAAGARIVALAGLDPLPQSDAFAEALTPPAGFPQRLEAERRLARLVAELGEDIDHAHGRFYPDRPEGSAARLLKVLARIGASIGKRLSGSGADLGGGDAKPFSGLAQDVGDLLQRAERLAALVKSEKDFLVAARQGNEAELADLVARRRSIAGNLRRQAPELGVREIADRIEAVVAVVDDFVAEINAGIAACVVIETKLAADTEHLLLLVRGMAVEGALPGGLPEAAGFPVLGEPIGRLKRGMLVFAGLERRRALADQGFWEWFPPEVLNMLDAFPGNGPGPGGGASSGNGPGQRIAGLLAGAGAALPRPLRDLAQNAGGALRGVFRPPA